MFYKLVGIMMLWLVVQNQAIEKFGNCKTAKGEDGFCVRLPDCNFALNLLRLNTDADYLKNSQCGYDKNQMVPERRVLICCAANDCKDDNVLPGNELPDTNRCGQFLEDKIYGGDATSLMEFPWAALIMHRIIETNAVGHHCGGTLINNRYVLTAAHCIDTDGTWEMHGVRLGDWDTTTDPDCDANKVPRECAPAYQQFEIAAAIAHSQYIPNSLDQYNDIALLRLKAPVTYSRFIQPICINLDSSKMANRLPEQTDTQVVGWGLTENLKPSNIKLKANLKIANEDKCRMSYRMFNRTVNGEYQFCAGGKQNIDTCRGDSGGPLMLKQRVNNKDVYFIEGIVSYGATPCGVANWPGVYTRVSNYVNWIKSTIQA